MGLLAYAISGKPSAMVWIPCPYCKQTTYSPESPWIRKEIETLGCGWCDKSVKGEERENEISRINNEIL